MIALFMAALPDPKSAESVGWLVMSLGAVVVIVVAILAGAYYIKQLRAERIAQPFSVEIAKKFATHEDLNKLDTDVQNQLKEMRSYVHETMHSIRNDIHNLSVNADSAREGLHDRINALVKVTYEMRGQLTNSLAREAGRHPRS